MDKTTLMARQAILNANHQLYGFELLYRGNRYDPESGTGGMGATTELLNHVYTSITDRNLNANKPFFINVEQDFIESPSFFPSQSDNIVLELLETVPATPTVLQKVKELRQKGFEFALDDYVFEPERDPFIPLSSIVKIDVLNCPMETIQANIGKLKQHNCVLLAEKVEDENMFEQCKEIGFDLFQGYYLELPKTVKGLKVSANKQLTVKLVAELTRPDITVEEVSDLIACDPKMALKVLLLVNSSLYSFVREINDVKEAVIAIGLEAVKQWALILAVVQECDQPLELFRTVLSRAKTLELYAKEQKLSNSGDYFALGLFSAIDVVLGIDMENIVDELPLSNELKSALLSSDCELGKLLQSMKRVEVAQSCGEDTERLLENEYWHGLVWTDQLMERLK